MSHVDALRTGRRMMSALPTRFIRINQLAIAGRPALIETGWRQRNLDIPIHRTAPLEITAEAGTQSLRGIAFMALGMFVFSFVDMLAKVLTESFHPIQVVWTRQLGLLFGVFILIGLYGPGLLRAAKPKLQLLRGACAAGSAALFIFAVAHVPLADAVAVSFVAPFIVTLLGALVLREPVGFRRWTAVTIGFAATLIIIRPGTGVLHPAVLLVLVAAFLFAIRQVISRFLSGSDKTSTTVAYTAIVSVALLSLPLPSVWITPVSGTQIGMMILMAGLAAFAEVMVIRALEIAHAVVVAPVQYTILIWGTFYGFVVFGDLPDFWTLVGALIIVATGIYTLNRERLAARRKAS